MSASAITLRVGRLVLLLILAAGAGPVNGASVDLDVTYIARLPRDCRMYAVDYPDGIPVLRPGTENEKRWPGCWEIVTFEAHVVNKGSAPAPATQYRWMINGASMGTGTLPAIDPQEEATATLDWPWNVCTLDTDHTDQTVSFQADFDNQVAEAYEQNNSVTDFIEAMSLAIYVEPQIYDAFNARLNLEGTRSFEDWIQRQIRAMNDNFARSTYPLAPNGCLERVRIDKIQVSSLPPNDRLADGRWQFVGDPAYAENMAQRVDGGLIHELMHQLGVIDLYHMPIGEGTGENRVLTPDGLPVGIGFGFARAGIMGGGDIAPHPSGASATMPQYCSAHSVLALNRNCGYKRGYYGEYMFDVPRNNYIRVLDASGQPAAGVDIKVYQDASDGMPSTPVITGLTDANGRFLLTNRPPAQTITTATGHTERANPFGTINVVGHNATLLIGMSRPGGDYDYRFLSIIEFNKAYWSGLTDEWEYTINSRLASASLPRIRQSQAAVEGMGVKLTWPAVPGAAGYRVYRASRFYDRADDPGHEFENWVFRPLATISGTGYTDGTIFENSRYAVAARTGDGSEGPLSNRIFAPRLKNPWAVGILPDNQRVVLDPQNGYAFLRQTSDGIYLANTGSVHNHVEYSHFIAIDSGRSRMLISHPGDYYNGPHSIRVCDYDGSLNWLTDFGTLGSGPGQFKNPAGVAVDAAGRIFAVDSGNHRVQVLTASGNFIKVYGGAGGAAGLFNNPQGIAVSPDHKLYVCDRDNRRVQVLQFDPQTNGISFVGTLTGRTLQQPTGVALSSEGLIFVTDQATGRVERYGATGHWETFITAPVAPYAGPLSQPTGIAIDHLGRVIVCDTGNQRVVTVAVRATGDLDWDGDVDQSDFGIFQRCLAGPGVVQQTPACLPARLDHDVDVDQEDLAVFRSCFSGPGVPAEPDCGPTNP